MPYVSGPARDIPGGTVLSLHKKAVCPGKGWSFKHTTDTFHFHALPQATAGLCLTALTHSGYIHPEILYT